jgi:ATP-dependent helicase HrpB
VLAPTDLPAEQIVDVLADALEAHRRAVVVAPPGAGKTTLLPLRLLESPLLADGGRIVMLEPRRLAARAAARRMAHLLNCDVGDLVGYQTRDERHIGPRTRIEVITEGILTRRLQHDPTLAGVAVVIFDEVHERNLATDVGLAFTLNAASVLRPDLCIVAMSATADTQRFATVLATDAGPAPVLAAEGRQFPVEVRWSPPTRGQRLLDAVAATTQRALRDDDGDVLVFLPGIGEIHRVAAMLSHAVAPTVDVRPLAGALSLAEQDAALAPSPPGRRRVVLATDIAETSLTVAGVRVVIDAGEARVPRFDIRTGMTRLTTVTTSRASAEQRAGRAGRTEAGVAYRLWSKGEHQARRQHLDAEITQVDLAGLALELALWGAIDDADVAALAFPDPPPRRALQQGRDLLRSLAALDDDGRATEVGRAMSTLGVHPRLAHMIAAASSDRDRALACTLAALLDERDVLRGRLDDLPADVTLRVGVVNGDVIDDRADRRALEGVRKRRRDLARRAGVDPDLVGYADVEHTGRVLLGAYPDRLAVRRQPGQFHMLSGAAAWLPRTDPLADEAFVVAADVDGDRKRTRIRRGGAISADDVAVAFGDRVQVRREVVWDRDRGDLVERVERRLGGVVLDQRSGRPEASPATTAAVLERVRIMGLGVLAWTPAASALRARVRYLHRQVGDPWPNWDDDALEATLDDWLAPFMGPVRGVGDLAQMDLTMVLRSQLPWPQGAHLDDLAPTHLDLPTGRPASIDYTAAAEGDAPPTVSVRVQQVFGLSEHPRVGPHREPVLLVLLSPADRPVQITADLPGFWDGSWAQVRADMAGRYPKHAWPPDPRRRSEP